MPSNPLGLPLSYVRDRHRTKDIGQPRVLWEPKAPNTTPISLYRQHINKKFGHNLCNSHELHEWTVKSPHEFWIDLYEYTGIIPPLPPDTSVAYDSHAKMADAPAFFPGHRLNFAENILVPNTEKSPNGIAITGLREGGLEDPEHITWTELWELVRLTRSSLIRSGVGQHDVVAALMANSIWIIVIFLASASVGASFTSISPDMGISGCTSRLLQVHPKIIFADIELSLRGTRCCLLGKIRSIQLAFEKTSQHVPQTIMIPTTHAPHKKIHFHHATPLGMSLHNFLALALAEDRLVFVQVPPSHPLVILYSSGTTGEPKCIMSPHISLLNYRKVAMLHNSLSDQSVVFQYSSTSWVVWNVMVGHLSVGARLITYDGGALYPTPATLLQICERYGVTYWGTSPRYLLELQQAQDTVDPRRYNLSSLKMVTTTGATLTGPQMRWFYTVFPSIVHLSSVAGSTEIASSWVASDPAGPVHENEMQMWALGHDCDVADSSTGESLVKTSNSISMPNAYGRAALVTGELVCRKPFASQPVGFWKDAGNKRYKEAYFERFSMAAMQTATTSDKVEYLDIWAQHDVTSFNSATHGVQITARSDSTLNPSGIRFGPSEIYAILSSPNSTLKDQISDSLCVGRKRQERDEDETVFLFLIAQKGHSVNESMIRQVKDEISKGLSPRHVPKFIIEIPEGSIPYTVNGKKVEVLVKKIISGDVVIGKHGNVVDARSGSQAGTSTIVNPECLEKYSKFVELERQSNRHAKL